MDNEILLELLESYIEEHEISTREILEAVDRSASYLLKDLIKELVKKSAKNVEEPSEPDDEEEIEDEDVDDEEENVEIPKPNLKIIKIFNAKDRLDELDEVPRLDDGEIDYWLASKMLCEKDGGRLPTMKELAEIASYMYQEDFEEYEDKYDLELKNELIPLGYYWSSREGSAAFAFIRSFGSSGSGYYDYYRYYALYALCLGD